MTRATLVYCAALFAVTVPSAAIAAPSINQDQGLWTDAFSDPSGLESGMVGAEAGQSNVVHDPFGRLITLGPADGGGALPTSGHFFTTTITPSSFSAWGNVWINFTSATATGVTVSVYDANTNASLGALTLTPSADPAYTRMASLAGIVPTTTTRIRLKVTLDRGTNPIAPAVKDLKVSWTPKSVLGLALEAPATKAAGDGIVLRVSASVSFVTATDFVAWVPAPTPTDNRYNQAAALSFVSATDGGVYTASGATVGGVAIPANSVYWSKPTAAAGTTFALYATFRSNNGLVTDIAYPFVAHVASTNGAQVDTATRTTKLTATPRGYLSKTSGGTFIISGQAFAPNDALITMRLTAGDYLFQPIPNGAQAWFEGVVWDSVQDFITKGAIAGGAAISNISNGGQFTATGTTVHGVAVPPNSVYWDTGTLNPGSPSSLSYQLQLNGQVVDDRSVTINDCSGGAREAYLASGQQAVSGVNACSPSGSCAPVGACHSVIIGVDNTPGFAFGKGDQLNGVTSIRTGINDNPNGFVTFGDAINFKLSVGNSAVSELNDVVMYDRVPAGTTFASASLPAGAGTVYYWTGAPATTPPAFFANPGDASDASPAAGWSTTAPAAASVTWVAYHIPRLRSTYFPDTSPALVIADFTVTANTTGNVCAATTVTNTGYASFSRYTPLGGAKQLIPGGPISPSDNEPVDVRPVLPNLSTSSVSGPASINPGETGTWRVNVSNYDPSNNPVDTAYDAVAVINIPQVTANGVSRYLDVVGITSGGGAVSYQLPGTLVVGWPSVLGRSSKTVTLTLSAPLGIRNNTTITMSANLSASDDFECAPIAANPTSQTVVTSSPALAVTKEVDLAVVAPGTSFEYTLHYTNNGTAPSSKTWVVDRIPNGASLVSVHGPANGQAWFSSQGPPFNAGAPLTGGLPSTLLPTFPFNDATIRAHFTQGTMMTAPGQYNAPSGAKWVAFLVDDPSFSPPILGVGLQGEIGITVTASPTASIGTTLENEALIVSDELLQSIGNRVVTTLSPRPGLDLTKTCPEVISAGEDFDYTVSWINDTTNEDTVVTIIDTLPLGFVPDFGSAEYSTTPLSQQMETLEDGRMRVTWIFPTQSSLGEEYVLLTGAFSTEVTSGSFPTNEVVGIAENAAGTYSASATCTTAVQNPDLFMRKLVDRADPRSGETVGFTLTVSNENLRRAQNVVVTDTLPAGLTAVPGSFQVTTPGWTLMGDPGAGPVLTFVLRHGSASTPGGYVPGNSGPINISFQATVGATVTPGTTLTNTVTVTSDTGEDGVFTNTATASVTTPLPDPYISMTGPPLVKPGNNLTWQIQYGNQTREDATGVVIVHTMPEGTNVNDTTDFTFTGSTAPSGVTVWYSANPLSTPPTVDSAASPGSDWTASPGAVVNYVLFSVGDLDALQGPFPITVSATAREPDGTLPLAGGTFVANAEISMIGATFPDADSSNNSASVTTKTPGVDVAVTVACSPDGADPGLPPGGIEEVTFTVENTGTVNVYGISVDTALAGILSLDSHSAGAVLLDTADGTTDGPVDTTGGRLAYPVSWNLEGNTFVLGQTVDSSAPDYYTNLGLKPGDSASITIRARVADGTADSTPFTSGVTVAAAGRPGDEPEEIFTNNSDSCGAVVYRADPFVVKTVENLTGDPALAEAGDVLRYIIQYGNAGNFAASDVSIDDTLPTGVTYLGGSLAGVPGSATSEFDDGTLSWTGGDEDGAKGLRVRFTDPVPAPANSTFFATTQADFERGTFDGTSATEEGSVVVDSNGTGSSELYYVNEQSYPFLEWGSHEGYFSGGVESSPRTFQFVVNPKYLLDDNQTLDLRSMAFFSTTDATPYTSRMKVTLAIMQRNLEPYDEYDYYHLTASTSKNWIPGTNQVVYDSSYEFPNGYYDYSIVVPFDAPFTWDMSKGALLVTVTYQPLDGTALIGAYYSNGDGSPGDVGQTCGGQGFDSESIQSCTNRVPLLLFGIAGGGSAGTYTSPVFPGEDEGNVVRWGRAVASSTIGNPDDENVTIDVVTPDGEVVASDIIPDGTGAYDLSGINPQDYPNLQLQAHLAGGAQSCTVDVAPDDARFIGWPTSLNENEVAAGFSYEREGYPDSYAAWAWTRAIGLYDLHAALPKVLDDNTSIIINPPVNAAIIPLDDNASSFYESAATGMDSDSDIVGWAYRGREYYPSAPRLEQSNDACFVQGDRTPVYVPAEADSELGGSYHPMPATFDAKYEDAVGNDVQIWREQYIYDPSVLNVTDPVYMTGIRFRGVTTEGRYVGRSVYVWVRVGVGKPAAQSGSDLGANYLDHRNDVEAYYLYIQTDGSGEWDIELPFRQPWIYDPAAGSLVVELAVQDDSLTQTMLGFDASPSNEAMAAWSSRDSSYDLGAVESDTVPWIQIGNLNPEEQDRAVILWTPDDGEHPTDWVGRCL
ncbi:MAG: DUF11 domain-containing protein, partial [Myxococcales bacterium]|nr:DUF11 domain-containing protein [Myxococcales bacterium]